MLRRTILVSLVASSLAACASGGPAPGRSDLARSGDPFEALAGRWEGYWEWDPWFRAAGKGKEDLTLVIGSVESTGARRAVYGTMTRMQGESVQINNAPVR